MNTKKEKPAISVVIPVYNGENFLKRTLDCLKAQTFSDFELIFIDDGSKDRTSQILETFQKQTKIPTTILTQKNKGPGAARNAGLAQAKGKYLALFDADDIYEPDLLEKLYSRAISTKADITVCRADEFWPDLDRFVETPWTINQHLLPEKKKSSESGKEIADIFSSADIKENFFEVFVGWTWDKLFKADYIKENGFKFQELRSSDDAFFCFMALIHAQKITIINDVLVHHVKYLPDDPIAKSLKKQDSTTLSVSNSREASWDHFYKALTAMKKQMIEWGIYNRFERDYINYFLNFSLWHLITLTGPAYFQLYDKLKNSWYKTIVGKDHKPDFFYSKFHYNLYIHMMKMSAEEFLFFVKQQETQRANDLEWHNQNLQRDLKAEQQKARELEDNNNRLKDRIHELENEVSDIKKSTAWKVGRAATVIPRKLKTLTQKDKTNL